MPHVIIKLWPGRSEDLKKKMVEKIVTSLKETIGASDTSISVAIEEIEKDKWIEEVYKPDIEQKESALYKKPGYTVEDLL